MIIKLRPRLAVSLGCAVVLFMSVGVALAQEDRQSDSDQRKKENDQSNPRQLESFELEHRNPQELQQILALRWQRTAAVLLTFRTSAEKYLRISSRPYTALENCPILSSLTVGLVPAGA